MKILVTDGDGRAALAVVRSLGKRGHEVYVAAASNKSLAACSRYCSRGIALPDPLFDGPAYAGALCELVQQAGIDVIFPMTEQSIYRLNPVRGSLPAQTILACPDRQIMRALSDKMSLFQLAESLGVDMPQTFYLNDRAHLPAVAGQIKSYPVVVKPALSRVAEGRGFVSGSVRYAQSRGELERLYYEIPVLRHPSLIQEKISGPGTGLFTLYDKDRHLAMFSHQRLREKPPSGGASVVCQSVGLDPEMVEAAHRLLSAVGFSGVAMVEFKRDQKDGRPRLMEVNARFWGSLQLAVACGIDFPGLYLDYLNGIVPQALIADYPWGHRLKWFFGTLDHLLIRLTNPDSTLHLPGNAPGKWRCLIEFFNIFEKNTSFDVWNRKDMGPFFHEAAAYFRAAAGRR